MDCVICRYGELALKGKNRGLFESRLVSNIKDCLKRNNISGRVEKIYGRMFVFTEDAKILSVLKDVFGLVSISPAISVENDVSKITSEVLDYVRSLKPKGKSFRITASRTDKDFPKKSQEMAVLLGSAVVDEFGRELMGPDDPGVVRLDGDRCAEVRVFGAERYKPDRKVHRPEEYALAGIILYEQGNDVAPASVRDAEREGRPRQPQDNGHNRSR